MKRILTVTALAVAVAAPAAAAADSPDRITRAEARPAMQESVDQFARVWAAVGYHTTAAQLDCRPHNGRRLERRVYRCVFGMVATATRAGAHDGSCLGSVVARKDHGRVAAHVSQYVCTKLFG